MGVSKLLLKNPYYVVRIQDSSSPRKGSLLNRAGGPTTWDGERGGGGCKEWGTDTLGRGSVWLIHMHFLREKQHNVAKGSTATAEMRCLKAADSLHLVQDLLTQHHQKLWDPPRHLKTSELGTDAKVNSSTCL